MISHSILRQILCGLLSVSLAIPVPVFAYSVQVTQTLPSTKLDKHIEELDKDVTRLLQRALYPKTAHLAAGPAATLADVEALRTRMDQWRKNLEQFAKSGLMSTSTAIVLGPIHRTLIEISLYFSCADRIELINTLLGAPVEPGLWASRYKLTFQLKNLGDYALFEGLANANDNFLKPEYRFFTELTPDHTLELQLKPGLVQAHEEARWASRPDQTSIANLAQFFATDMLLTNQILIGELEGVAANNVIRDPPRSLYEKFPSLWFKHEQAAREQIWLKGRALRKGLGAKIPELLTELHTDDHYFINAETMSAILKIINPQLESVDELVQASLPKFQELEAIEAVTLLPSIATLLPADQINPTKLPFQLVRIIAQAKGMIARQHILANKAIATWNLQPDQVSQIVELFSQRTETYLAELKEATKSNLSKLTHTLQVEQSVDSWQMGKFTTESLRLSGEIAKSQTSLDLAVQPQALSATMSEELSALKLTERSASALQKVLNTADFAKARSDYHSFLAAQLQFFEPANPSDGFLSSSNQVEYANLKKWVASAHWVDRDFSKAVNSYQVAPKLLSNLPKDLKSNLEGWVEAGRIMRFFEFSDVTPRLADLKLSEQKLKRYRQELLEDALKGNPILDLEVAGQNSPKKKIWQALVEAPPEAHEILKNGLAVIKSQLDQDLQTLVTGRPIGLFEKAKVAMGLQAEASPNAIPREVLFVMSKSVALAQQVGAYSSLVEKYKTVLQTAERESQERQAWNRLTSINGNLMLGMLAWYIGGALIKFPAPKVGAFLGEFERQVLNPIFGRRLLWLNNTILAIWGASIVDKAYTAFSEMPDKEKLLKDFVSCSVAEPCLVDRGQYVKYSDLVTSTQIKVAIEAVTLPILMAAFAGGSYLFGYLAPTLRQNYVSRLLERQMTDIGFQNGRFSFFEQDLREMSEVTIRTLDRRSHPALDSFRATKPDRPTAQQSVQVAKFYLASQIRQTAMALEKRVANELAYWKSWQKRLQPSIDALGLGEMWNNPIAFHEVSVRVANLKVGPNMSREYITYLQDSQRNIADFLIPHFTRVQSDPIYAALMTRVWGQPVRSQISLDKIRDLRAMGGSFQKVAVIRPTPSRSRDLVPLAPGARPKARTAQTIEIQLASRTSVYRIENAKWLKELRNWVEASDFWQGTAPDLALLKGSTPQPLLGKRDIPLLPYFRSNDAIKGWDIWE